MKTVHGTVFGRPGVYAGWPANHGAWQWGNELLVGFLMGSYSSRNSMHHIQPPFKKLLARSRNGGVTWTVEHPNVDFEAAAFLNPAPEFDLEDTIIRCCGVYDHGGDECDLGGGFYSSVDRGKHWSGPFEFSGLTFPPGQINTSRTCVVDNLVFMSCGQESMWGTDHVFMAVHDGKTFSHKSVVLEDNARAVMPAAVRTMEGDLVVAMRRRKTGRREGWIDAVYSSDNGSSWSAPVQVGVTGSHNGNPPAITQLRDGRLLCCFANRDHGSLCAAISGDCGRSWGSTFNIRTGGRADIGYPRLFLREDGIPVAVYYWAEKTEADQPKSLRYQHIAWTSIKGIGD